MISVSPIPGPGWEGNTVIEARDNSGTKAEDCRMIAFLFLPDCDVHAADLICFNDLFPTDSSSMAYGMYFI